MDAVCSKSGVLRKGEKYNNVEGYEWFGKPHINQNNMTGEEVFFNTVKYEESLWIKLRRKRGIKALYRGCVYVPTDSTSIFIMDSFYKRLKEDVLSFREKGNVVLLGDFNTRVGRSAQINDVIGMIGEDTCNCTGN